jgi:hypothetical protein
MGIEQPNEVSKEKVICKHEVLLKDVLDRLERARGHIDTLEREIRAALKREEDGKSLGYSKFQGDLSDLTEDSMERVKKAIQVLDAAAGTSWD